jgi:hypothetical protein
MLQVGIDSYIDVDDADQIVKKLFLSNQEQRIFWEGLSEDDKETLLTSVTSQFDNSDMWYVGVQANKNQSLQFPRMDNGNYIDTPYSIKAGLILQGLRMFISSLSSEDRLKHLGIKSFQDGSGAKIEFADVDSYNKLSSTGIYLDIYNRYFKPYTIFGN